MAIACTNNIVFQHSNDISAEIPGNEAINTLSRTYNIFQMLFPVKRDLIAIGKQTVSFTYFIHRARTNVDTNSAKLEI